MASWKLHHFPAALQEILMQYLCFLTTTKYNFTAADFSPTCTMRIRSHLLSHAHWVPRPCSQPVRLPPNPDLIARIPPAKEGDLATLSAER